ncbi:hypothetical protein IscW_ISCW023308 [Ixodes scapularis]|uniref:Uncharacterized protein n=1 Tax=Ixodes scapularis TaxID=6945 RepID=B7QKD4_IXOSC|nr:hypothetical protein IscW_ISCW023308 [Ixodes scapularis]|eukprot:XP_002415639.1 hypothetical protein IscW_ISCW023308 [Ixodes scapularis]
MGSRIPKHKVVFPSTECPLALEAAKGLLELGVKPVEVAALVLHPTGGSSLPPNMEWLGQWIKANAHFHAREYASSIANFKQLEARVHSLDPYQVRGMDIYAALLAKDKKVKELETFVLVMVNALVHASECTYHVQLYASVLMKNPVTVEKAKLCLEKALKLDSNHLPAVYLLAEIYDQERAYLKGIELYVLQTPPLSRCWLFRVVRPLDYL